MRTAYLILILTSALSLVGAAHATGLATCESGPKSQWKEPAKLEQLLVAKGYSVRRIKEDGGCYEAYVVDAQGQRAELYFHPVTLDPVPVKAK